MAVTYPDNLVSPYAPVVVTQTTNSLTVAIDGGPTVELTRELKDGEATFDVSNVLRTVFKNEQKKVTVGDAPKLSFIRDFLLSGPDVSLSNSSATYTVTPQRVKPIRGKRNSVQVWNYPAILCALLQLRKEAILKRYEGFPLQIGLQARADDTPFTGVLIDGNNQRFMFGPDGILLLDLVNVVSLTTGNYTIAVEDACIPDDPVYVRWINVMGGWEYWMFDGSRGLGQRVERGESFKLAGFYDLDAAETDGEMPPTVTDYITCGAEQLERPEFEALKGIATSPYVQIYDTVRGLFTRCLVGNTDIVWDTQRSRGQIDLELTLMSPYTQF